MGILRVDNNSYASNLYQSKIESYDNSEEQKAFKKTDKKIHLSDKVEISREGLEKSKQADSDRGTVAALSQADIEAKVVELTDNSLIFDTRADILKGIREEKGSYDYSDIVNVTGYAYAKCYADIEKKYEENPDKYINPDGTKRTKEQAIAELDEMYEAATAWDTTNARIAAETEKFKGNIDIIPKRDLEDFKESYSDSKMQHMNQYREDKENFSFHNFSFKQSWLMGKLYDLGWTQVHQK